MKISALLSVALLFCIAAFAQKREEGFDFWFKPTENAPRYYVITEKKDSGWHRVAYYLPERSMAMDAWYKDADAKIPHGPYKWYYANRFLQKSGRYENGKKQGAWLAYSDDGHLTDSINYNQDKLIGISLKWTTTGMQTDSMNFDGRGNGVEVGWHDDGSPSDAGYWENDTTKRGRWKYFYRNGKLKATEDYANGKRVAASCYDENGVLLDSSLCMEKEAEFPGGDKAWSNFLSNNLDAAVPVRNNAPLGQFTSVVQFIVDKDGRISDIKPLTHFGFGMEEEVMRIIRKCPKWIPAQQFGKPVRAYRLQPITFVVSK